MPSTDNFDWGDDGDSGSPGFIRDITFPNGGSLLRRGNFDFGPTNAYSEYIVSSPHRVAVRELNKYWAARGLNSYSITRYDLSFTVEYGGRSVPITMRQADYRDPIKRQEAIDQAINGIQFQDDYNARQSSSSDDYFPNIDWGPSGGDTIQNVGNYVYNDIANPGQIGFEQIGSALNSTTDGDDGDSEQTTEDLDLDDMSLYGDPEASDDDPVDYGEFAGMFDE